MIKELSVDANVENITIITKFIDSILEEYECGMKTKAQIDIAVDELAGNVAQYAYISDKGDITVRIEITDEIPKSAVITFIDSGIPYDPIERSNPVTNLPAEEREIGGLGIYIVKKTMDDMKYEYKDGQNILVIRKSI